MIYKENDANATLNQRKAKLTYFDLPRKRFWNASTKILFPKTITTEVLLNEKVD